MNMTGNRPCQIYCLESMSPPLDRFAVITQKRNRLKRIARRRFQYLLNWLREWRQGDAGTIPMAIPSKQEFNPGDPVRIKSIEAIKQMLNRWNQLKGCGFMEEMRPYCGTTQKVLKAVEKFLDERDYLIKKCKGILILERVMCEGTKDFGACDRSCYFFWREEWLERIG